MKIVLFIITLYLFLIGNIYIFFLTNKVSLDARTANDGINDRIELEIRAMKGEKALAIDKKIYSLGSAFSKIISKIENEDNLGQDKVNVAKHIIETPYPKNLSLSKKYQKILEGTSSPRAFEILISLFISNTTNEIVFLKATSELYENNNAAEDLFYLLDEFSSFPENDNVRIAIFDIASKMPEIGRKIYTQVLEEFMIDDWVVDNGKLVKNKFKSALVAHQAFLNIAPDVETAINETVRSIVLNKRKVNNQRLIIAQFIKKYPGLEEDIEIRLAKFGVSLDLDRSIK